MIKKISIQQDYIEILEDKKGIFRNKERTSKIKVESIDKIEKMIENNKLIGIILWKRDIVLYAIGYKNYTDDLIDLYNRISSALKDSTEIIETEL